MREVTEYTYTLSLSFYLTLSNTNRHLHECNEGEERVSPSSVDLGHRADEGMTGQKRRGGGGEGVEASTSPSSFLSHRLLKHLWQDNRTRLLPLPLSCQRIRLLSLDFSEVSSTFEMFFFFKRNKHFHLFRIIIVFSLGLDSRVYRKIIDFLTSAFGNYIEETSV